jgi:hypothetical protein
VDKRFQVFISSTYADLTEERAEVVSMLLNLDALPAGMELFPATNDDAWTLIKRVIDESDYYLLVVGGRYGSVDDGTDLSYTEKEFEYAVEEGKPVMAFLHGDPGKIPAEKTDQSDEAREKLDAFREKVQKAVHVNFWTQQSELAGLVAKSFVKIQKSHPAVGWIRGDVETATSALAEINDLRKQLDVARQQIASSKEEPPPGTSDLAQGSDEFRPTLPAETEAHYEGAGQYDWATWTGSSNALVTWDELFAAVGPDLLDEVEQKTLRRNLNSWLFARFGPKWRQAVEKKAKDDGGRAIDRFRGARLTLTDEDFGTVIVQLRALGLIHRSERKRAVSDKGTYWSLTPFGDTRLTTLRALRRDSTRDTEQLQSGDASTADEEATA